MLSKSPDPLSPSTDSDSENEDEIFLVFRGKPNSRVSSFDECQAASGRILKQRILYRCTYQVVSGYYIPKGGPV